MLIQRRRLFVSITGKASIEIPYRIKATQPKLFSHLKRMSFETSNDIASKMEAR